MNQEYVPPNLIEISQNSQKLALSPKKMTAHLFNSYGSNMLKLVGRLFQEAETAKFHELTKLIAILSPYFFIKSENAMELRLSDELIKVLENPQDLSTESLERIVNVIKEEAEKNSKKPPAC